MYYQDSLQLLQSYPSPEGIWELVEKIGEGNYGIVFKGRNRRTGKMSAVKIMDAVLDKEEDIHAELNVFQKYSSHENIVDCYGIYLKKQENAIDQLWIVMELCTAGSVTDLVKKMKEKEDSLPEDIVAYILHEVLAGLIYLHNNNIIHRDIKGHNVLITHSGKIRLIDFGISAAVEHAYGRRRTAIGTPYWMSPEVIACEHQLEYEYDSRCDIWSLGITAIEIVDGTPPLFGENPMRALYKIPKNPPPKLQNPTKCSIHLNQFIARCLIKDFERRPTAFQLSFDTLITSVPKDSRMLRRKLMAIIDNYIIDGTLLSDHSSPATSKLSSALTTQSNTLNIRTTDLVNNLATLEFINEKVIVGQLMKRYNKGLIYTYVGDILISINPFQQLPDLYHVMISKQYRGVTKTNKGQLPPHIYAIAGSAFQSMLRENKNQCCVVSGESGAGKTEASNILVQQFMQIGRAQSNVLESKILSLNPLLESFGNARTIINNNSSRFGKYLELNFTASGQIVGAHLSEYLLEKSRVIVQGGAERNFHIFYYLLAGLRERNQLKQYKLQQGQQYRYLRQIGTSRGTGKQNQGFAEKFDLVENAFNLFGFTKEEFEEICSILAAILIIGNIHVEEDENSYFHVEGVSIITNGELIDNVSELLKIKPSHLERVIISSTVMTHGETIITPNTVEQAMDSRDAIAKSLYGRLFSWIVNKINPSLNPTKERNSSLLNIGILDIFGFENLKMNSFEQLCINITNEQLQFYFNQHVFAWEQEEYDKEGIMTTYIDYTDNRSLLELLLNRPMGLLALLDEESKFPKATDVTLAIKLHKNFSTSDYYTKPKDNGPAFIISHYAGPVLYETQGFLEKNRDTLKTEVIGLMRESDNSIVNQLFAVKIGNLFVSEMPPSGTPIFSPRPSHKNTKQQSIMTGHSTLHNSISMTTKRSQTVSTYFFYSLKELMAKMLAGTPHFVRCIRPNDLKIPSEFHAERVTEQLRHTGVLETTRIRKEGYSHRILFDDFLQRYQIISFPLSQYVPPTPINCKQILMQAGLEKWEIGKTKVFLKYFHIDRLWHVLNNYHKLARKIQNATRCWLARKELSNLRRERAAVHIQSAVRGFLARKFYIKTLDLRTKAAVIIQSNIRGYLCRLKYQKRASYIRSIVMIQSVWRMKMCQKRYNYKNLNTAAKIIQKCFKKWMESKQTKQEMGIIQEKSAVIIQRGIRNLIQRRAKERQLQLEKSLINENSPSSNGVTRDNQMEYEELESQSIKGQDLLKPSIDKHDNQSKSDKTDSPSLLTWMARDEQAIPFIDKPQINPHLEMVETNLEQQPANINTQTIVVIIEKGNQQEETESRKIFQEKSTCNRDISIEQQVDLRENTKPTSITRTKLQITTSPTNGQAKRVRKFFEDLMKQNQTTINHHDNNLRQFTNKVQRNNKRGLRSDVFQKLIEHFDTQ